MEGKITLKEFKNQMKNLDEDEDLDFEDEDEEQYKKMIIPKHGNKKKK